MIDSWKLLFHQTIPFYDKNLGTQFLYTGFPERSTADTFTGHPTHEGAIREDGTETPGGLPDYALR